MIVEHTATQAKEVGQKTELELIVEEILISPKNRLIQTSRENIEKIIEQTMARISSQKEKIPSYQKTLNYLRKITSHLLGLKVKEPQKIPTAVTIDCAYLASDKEDPNNIRIRVLIEIFTKFSEYQNVLKEIVPNEVDSALELVVKKSLENLKLKNGTSSQILFVKNLDLLHKNSQALIVELLFKDLSYQSSALTINILHTEPIATYVYDMRNLKKIGFGEEEIETFERKTV